MKCDQCEMVQITLGAASQPCHESGCPNRNARWDAETESWVQQYTCFVCGYECDQGVVCCSDEVEEEAQS